MPPEEWTYTLSCEVYIPGLDDLVARGLVFPSRSNKAAREARPVHKVAARSRPLHSHGLIQRSVPVLLSLRTCGHRAEGSFQQGDASSRW